MSLSKVSTSNTVMFCSEVHPVSALAYRGAYLPAPSQIPEAFAAVTTPSFLNTGRRPAIFSFEVSARGCSSLSISLKRVQIGRGAETELEKKTRRIYLDVFFLFPQEGSFSLDYTPPRVRGSGSTQTALEIQVSHILVKRMYLNSCHTTACDAQEGEPRFAPFRAIDTKFAAKYRDSQQLFALF